MAKLKVKIKFHEVRLKLIAVITISLFERTLKRHSLPKRQRSEILNEILLQRSSKVESLEKSPFHVFINAKLK